MYFVFRIRVYNTLINILLSRASLLYTNTVYFASSNLKQKNGLRLPHAMISNPTRMNRVSELLEGEDRVRHLVVCPESIRPRRVLFRTVAGIALYAHTTTSPHLPKVTGTQVLVQGLLAACGQ